MTGIGGVGMSGVARMLLSEGVVVTGSDIRESPVLALLRDAGAHVETGQCSENVPSDAEMLVVSAAVADDNPEIVEAKRRGLEVIKYAAALGLLMAEKTGVAVSGTHGKTTTTAMLAWILSKAGRDPSFVVGAELPDLGTSSREGSGDVFIAEACEYDRSFLNLRPKVAVINNIEEDHLDYYRDLGEIIDAFRQFTSLLPPDGLLLASAHDRNALSVLRDAPSHKETFAVGLEADWRADGLSVERGRYAFDVIGKGRTLGRAALAVPGVHNVINALAATAVSVELGVDFPTIVETLGSFRGAARRFAVIGDVNGVTVIDDYAHHPTEVQVTLKAARDCYEAGRIWVVFQPHQYSRTRFFLKDFARSFAQVDRVIVPDIYFVRDSDRERTLVSASDLVREMTALGYRAEYIPDWAAIVDKISRHVRPGDAVITMGAGNVNEIAYALLERLRSDT
ncbi:MAG: UDP-N-acetylmuramate--L-alanine ligase [Planctomycetota bacterium]|jgi:UDP-N-acetylmuramate--alanine ligase